MKKVYFLAVVLFLSAIAFTSCKKDNQYSPKSKIKSVYVQQTVEYDKPLYQEELNRYIDKYLDEKWTWDGKRLKTIDSYYSDGSIYETIQFTYDSKNRFDRVIFPSYQLQYRYDDSKLVGIDVYSGTTIIESYTMYYDGKKVSRISYIDYDDSNNKKYMEEFGKYNPLSMIFNKEIANNIMSGIDKADKNTRGMTTAEYSLTWNKNNITRITGTIISSQATTTYTYDYEYDTHKNPYNGLFLSFNTSYLTENNITSIRSTLTQGNIRIDESSDISYTYDKGFPKVATSVYKAVNKGYYYLYVQTGNSDYYPSYTCKTITEYQY